MRRRQFSIHYFKQPFSRLSRNDKIVDNCLKFMLNYIVTQMGKVEKSCLWPVHSDQVILCKRFKKTQVETIAAKLKTLKQSFEQEIRQESEFWNVSKSENICPWKGEKNVGTFHQRNNHDNLYRKLYTRHVCVPIISRIIVLFFFSLSILTCFNSHFSGEVILWTLRLAFGSSSS